MTGILRAAAKLAARTSLYKPDLNCNFLKKNVAIGTQLLGRTDFLGPPLSSSMGNLKNLGPGLGHSLNYQVWC